MKQLVATQTLRIPKNGTRSRFPSFRPEIDWGSSVTVTVKSRVVKVEGPRGALTKSFKHLNLDIYLTGPAGKKAKKTAMKVDLWLGSKVEAAAIRTVCSHVKNMITGVTRVRLSCLISFPSSACIRD